MELKDVTITVTNVPSGMWNEMWNVALFKHMQDYNIVVGKTDHIKINFREAAELHLETIQDILGRAIAWDIVMTQKPK